MTTSTEPVDASGRRSGRQLPALIRASHPRQAVAFAVVVGLLVGLTGRPAREVALAAAAVLVAQLIMGLVNDLLDVDLDKASALGGQADRHGRRTRRQRQLRGRRAPPRS